MGFEWLALKNYKRHYICLSCKKGFKRAPESDMKNKENHDLSGMMENYYNDNIQKNILDHIQELYENTLPVCPQCQGRMIQVPYTFEVPAMKNKKEWKQATEQYGLHNKYIFESAIHWHQYQMLQKGIDKELNEKLEINLKQLRNHLK